jgi:hypothetical protein
MMRYLLLAFQLDDVVLSFEDVEVMLDSTIEAYDVWELPQPERVKLYKYWLKQFRKNQVRLNTFYFSPN